MMGRLLKRLASCAVVTLVGCGGGGSNGGGSTPSVAPPADITRTYSFPAGSATASAGNTAWDIVGVKTTLSQKYGGGGGNLYDTLRVDVTFAQDVSNALPAPGQPLSKGTQLGVHVLIDSDGNPNTGVATGCSFVSGLTPFEYASDQGNDPSRLPDGNYSIIGPNGYPISGGGFNGPSEAVTTVTGHVLSQSFFLPAIGVTSESAAPTLGVAVSAFNGAQSVDTNCVPGGSAVELRT